MKYIGKPLGRAEGPEKVRGSARFPADIKLDGMLVGACLRSPFPYARIVSIDVDAAQLMPGVHAVLTGADLPDERVGRALRDFEPLAKDVVRYTGQKVVAIAAETRDIADDAMAVIKVEYEELKAVFDPIEALEVKAPVLHPQFDSYLGQAKGQRFHPNVVARSEWTRGDVQVGFEEADRVIEHTFRTQRQHQAYVEPHACVVKVDDDGRAQVWANSKAPFQLRQQIAEGVGLPTDKVTINASFIGGDFGGKGGFMDTHVAYWLARKTGRPVRMTMDYTEELTAGNPRHGAVMTFRTGVMNDGRIIARQAELIFDGGAYGAFRPSAGASYGPRCLGAYRMDHAAISSTLVYTNLVPCGSMRSPGDPQSIFASEAHIDLVARELEMDPLEFRLANFVDEGDSSPLGRKWREPMARRVLERASEEIGYADRTPVHADGRKTGIGFAVSDRATGGGICTARVRIDLNGRTTLWVSLRDTGSGFYTMLRQVVAEELGVPYDAIDLETWSTDALDNDGGVGGARITNAGGNAALNAARGVRDTIAGFAANKYGWSPDDIEFVDETVLGQDGASKSLVDVMRDYGEEASAQFTYEAPPDPDTTVFTAQAAEVAVDEETGEIEVLRFVTAHDVGTILNPIAHQGQVEGGFVQGLGYALMEELKYEEGFVMNAHLGDYKVPTMRDIPPLTTLHVRSAEDGPAPYGGKGIGEQSVSGVAPAIVNALLDATGKSMRSLPVTAEKMLKALES
ncbi:MAG: xanthine dehydrogenase family protein molybdopterin-binding subunit [Gammaproteobacteria bacterium]|nr:xanthine dehydrogenase family protein molybdopterin-binding subunit [Gammaproteobacteria bacterium]